MLPIKLKLYGVAIYLWELLGFFTDSCWMPRLLELDKYPYKHGGRLAMGNYRKSYWADGRTPGEVIQLVAER